MSAGDEQSQKSSALIESTSSCYLFFSYTGDKLMMCPDLEEDGNCEEEKKYSVRVKF